LTVAIQSVAQCVTYQIVVIAQKLYVLRDTQLLACCTHSMNQNSILQHCKLSKRQKYKCCVIYPNSTYPQI